MKIVTGNFIRDLFIKDIMDEFDWGKIQKVMEFLDWRWMMDNERFSIPNTFDLQRTARKLLEEVWHGTEKRKCEYQVGTGGFKAVGYYDEKKQRVDLLELKFVLMSWYADESSDDIIKYFPNNE